MRTLQHHTWMILTLLPVWVGVPGFAIAETYTIDPVHSSIVFKISHLGVSPFFGRINNTGGTLEFDENQPEKCRIEVKVQAQDIDTANDKRDTHLKSQEFFNVARHPVIQFQSKQVKKTDQRNYLVTGELTLLGVTKPITVTATHFGSGQDPWGGYRIGFGTTFKIKRTDFGMNFMTDSLGDEVEIMVGIEGVRN